MACSQSVTGLRLPLLNRMSVQGHLSQKGFYTTGMTRPPDQAGVANNLGIRLLPDWPPVVPETTGAHVPSPPSTVSVGCRGVSGSLAAFAGDAMALLPIANR